MSAYYEFKLPTKILSGDGALEHIPHELEGLGASRPLLLSDQGLEQVGTVKIVQEALHQGGMDPAETFCRIPPDSSIEVVNQVAALFRGKGCDSLIALGGGSVIDTAKGVGMVLAQAGSDLLDAAGCEVLPRGAHVPFVAIPTTAGTGSEVTASAVITDEATHFKSTVFSYYNLPKFAILDPELIMTAPAHIAAACGVDALIHALEAYLSNNANPFSDAFAEKAMELIGTHLRSFVANRHDEEAACAMMVGSTFAGIAFAWARLGNIHAMSHPVSGFFGVAHGVANSVLMPTVIEYNALADKGRYEKIYNYISVDKEPVKDFKPEMLVAEVQKLNDDLGIPKSLKEVGVTEDKIPAMAADAMKSGNIPANPRQTTLEDITELYQKAF